VRFVIDTLARFIIEDGTDLEQLILEGESRNPEFAFLRNVDSPEHMYYRWRLYSLCNEDLMSKWRTEPFVMIETSNRIHPPPMTVSGYGTATAAQRGTSSRLRCGPAAPARASLSAMGKPFNHATRSANAASTCAS
jgi:U2-associated protein SR140